MYRHTWLFIFRERLKTASEESCEHVHRSSAGTRELSWLHMRHRSVKDAQTLVAAVVLQRVLMPHDARHTSLGSPPEINGRRDLVRSASDVRPSCVHRMYVRREAVRTTSSLGVNTPSVHASSPGATTRHFPTSCNACALRRLAIK